MIKVVSSLLKYDGLFSKWFWAKSVTGFSPSKARKTSVSHLTQNYLKTIISLNKI